MSRRERLEAEDRLPAHAEEELAQYEAEDELSVWSVPVRPQREGRAEEVTPGAGESRAGDAARRSLRASVLVSGSAYLDVDVERWRIDGGYVLHSIFS